MFCVVGGIIEKDGKILLVQEGKDFCYGKYNIPSGRLEEDETLIDGALRKGRNRLRC